MIANSLAGPGLIMSGVCAPRFRRTIIPVTRQRGCALPTPAGPILILPHVMPSVHRRLMVVVLCRKKIIAILVNVIVLRTRIVAGWIAGVVTQGKENCGPIARTAV